MNKIYRARFKKIEKAISPLDPVVIDVFIGDEPLKPVPVGTVYDEVINVYAGANEAEPLVTFEKLNGKSIARLHY